MTNENKPVATKALSKTTVPDPKTKKNRAVKLVSVQHQYNKNVHLSPHKITPFINTVDLCN